MKSLRIAAVSCLFLIFALATLYGLSSMRANAAMVRAATEFLNTLTLSSERRPCSASAMPSA